MVLTHFASSSAILDNIPALRFVINSTHTFVRILFDSCAVLFGTKFTHVGTRSPFQVFSSSILVQRMLLHAVMWMYELPFAFVNLGFVPSFTITNLSLKNILDRMSPLLFLMGDPHCGDFALKSPPTRMFLGAVIVCVSSSSIRLGTGLRACLLYSCTI